MILRVVQTLAYAFDNEVRDLSLTLRVAPRSGGRQECLQHRLHVTPRPADEVSLRDEHANDLVRVTLPSLRALRVEALSSVRLSETEVAETAGCEESMRAPSPCSPLGDDFAALARPCFAGAAPLDRALEALGAAIRERLRYDEVAARVGIDAASALRAGTGVCQDFAHVAVSCLRSLGMPARYAGGYLLGESGKAVARPHAWASVWSLARGWRDFDPLLGEAALGRHLAIAIGRDYGDVAPVEGTFDGAGAYRLTTRVTATSTS